MPDLEEAQEQAEGWSKVLEKRLPLGAIVLDVGIIITLAGYIFQAGGDLENLRGDMRANTAAIIVNREAIRELEIRTLKITPEADKRISVVEANFANLDRRLAAIEKKLDKALGEK